MKREIFIGKVGVGGKHPVSLQSMTNTVTEDVPSTLNQISSLYEAGCDIIRVAVPDRDALKGFKEIIRQSVLPVVADIHFDTFLALKSIEYGANSIRINPGNIGSKERIKEILILAKERGIPIRIGVNAGSIEKKYRSGRVATAENMVSSVLDYIKFFEDNQFLDIKISVKATDVKETVAAYRMIDKKCDYPLHLGVTEAGTVLSGSIKSAVGIGSLLLDGIGNTVRVSLTANPIEEIRIGKEILAAAGLRRKDIEIISCPTCSRTTVELIDLVKELEKRLVGITPARPLKIAVMGCEVNGPGEARGADIAVAFSKHNGFIYKNGKMIEKVSPKEALQRLVELIKTW